MHIIDLLKTDLVYLLSQSFCKIFCGLSLASSSRTLRSSPQVQLQSPH